MSLQESQSHSLNLSDIPPITSTIIPFTDALLVTIGTTKQLGFMHESTRTGPSGAPASHRVMLGDRDDLVGRIFGERLGEEILKVSAANRVVLSIGLPREVMADYTKCNEIVTWLTSKITE